MIIISEFKARIVAELDTSKVEQQINQLNNKNVKFNVDTGKTQKDINGINNAINSTNKTAMSFCDTLKKSLNIGSAAAITAKGFQLIRTAANNAVDAVKELGGAITDLRIATGESYDTAKGWVKNYNSMAQSLGSTTTEVSDSAVTWVRQGKSIQEANTLIKDSMILSKVGMLESSNAAELLTLAMKGYKIEVNDAIGIIDKLTAVDANAAVNAGALAEGMSKTAAVASDAGVEMNKLVAYLAAVGEVNGDLSAVGNSFKTIFSRMSDIKANKLELIDEDGTTESLSDVETTLKNVGIDLRRTVNEFNSSSDVLDALAEKWDSLSSVQQAALSKAFAGVRQQNNFRVLMQNYDNVKKYADIAANSAGTAESKFSAYLDSIEAKVNSLQAAFESLVFNSSLTDMYSGIIEGSTAVLEFLDNTKLLQGALSGLATAGAIEGIKALISGIQNSAEQMSNFSNALTLLSSGSKVMGDDFQDLLLMTENLSQSQLKVVLSSEALSAEQRIAILTSQGMTTAQAEAALSSMGLATAEGAATASTVTLSSAVKGLWATLMANPLLLIIAGVTVGTMAINALAGAAKEASEAADELKAKSMEEAQAAREEVQTLDELIAKYKELAESDTQDSSTREEIKSVQGEIVDLVGQQAANLDLVNGKLDDEIEKLNQIKKGEADKAVEASVGAYHAAKDSHDKAMGEDSVLWLDGYAYVSDDWWNNEDEVIDILQNNGYKNSVQKGGVFNSHTFITDSMDEDMNVLEGATEKAEYLTGMIDTIKEKYADYASSDIYNALVKQRDAYLQYANDMKTAAKELADAEIISSTYDESISKMSVNSLDNYSEYRDKLIELVKNSPNLSEAISSGDLTDNDIAGQVDNYLATIPKYSEYYNQFSKLEKQKEKIAEVKKAFTDSDWFKDASWNVAEQRLNDFNNWFDNLSDDDKEIVYDISCNTDTAKFNLEDWQNALENYNTYTKQSAEDIEANVSRATENTKALISGISSAQEALSSQSTGNSLSVEDFNSDELADYTSALEYHNGVMQLNADKVNEIIKAKSQEQIEINNTNKALAQSTYLDNAAQIEKLRQKIKDKNFAEGESEESIQNNIDALLEENGAIKSNCDAYDLMNASLQEATDAYHNWLNAQNAAQSGDMFDDTLDAINRINETLNDTDSEYYGRVGRTDYQAALNLIIPDTVNSEDEAKVNAYLQSIYDMFTYDDDGNRAGLNIENFCQQAVDKGLMVLDESTDSYQIAGQKTMEDFAEGLNLSLPLVQAMFGEMEEFGGEFSWADEAVKTIGDLGVAANESAEALLKTKGNEDLAIKLDVSEIEGTDEKISTLESTIEEMQNVKGKANIDASEVEYANQIIEYCVAQQQNLSEPIVMSVDTSAISEKNAEAIGQIQEFKRACNDLELKQKLGVDTTDAQSKVNTLASDIKNIDPKIAAELSLNTSSVENLKTSINNITGDQLVKIGIDDSAIVGWTADNKQAKVTYDVDSTAVDTYKAQDDSKTATVTYHKISTEVDQYNPSNLSRTVTYHIKTNGTVGVNGTAHIAGTAFAGGNWGAKQGGNTLVGELGKEIIVDPHTGRWYTVGDTGAEFVDIPKGAIVFNHKQTESLLANGYVAGRASALVSGTAMVTGGIKRTNAQTSTKSGGNSTSNYGKSSSNKSSSSSSKSSSKNSDSDDKEPQIFDWIEIALNRIQRAIDNLSKKAESTFKKLSTRLSATNQEIGKVNEEINLQQKAADRYMKEANKVGLSSGLAKKVREGTIDINEYDEDTQELISDYQKWYEKALDCKDAIADLHEELASLYEDNFNNVKDDYENQLSLYEHLTNTYETGVDLLDAKGYMASTKYYSAMQDVEKKNISIRKKELADLEKQFSAAMNSGEIEKNSEAWYAMQNEINGVKEVIAESEVNLAEFAKTMREIEWERFDYIQERIEQITQEADFLIDLMSSKELYDDKGQLNNEGMATMGLHGQNYNVYMAQADQYAQEILDINKQIAKDPYNTELIARREELLGLQQDSISAAEDEKQAIVDMVEEGINRELDALKELIDTYTDALDSAKDLYDYQNKVSEKADEIASLQKQLSAYKGDNSEETRATIQKLEVDLSKAQEDLAKTEYEQFITDQKKLLDELYTEYESILNQRLDDVDALISDMIDQINLNADSINNTLTTTADSVGYTMSDNMQKIWDGSTNALDGVITKYGDKFDAQFTAVNTVLNSISVAVASMVSASDKKAAETVKNTTTTTTPTTTTSTSKPSTTTTKPTQSTEKKVTVGGKINAKGAKIYSDSYGGGKQNQYFASDPIYTVLGENNGYWKVRYHKLSSGVTGWFKKGDVKAYKTGGLVDYTGLAQVDGTPGKPELMLNANDTENFLELRDMLRIMALQPLTIGESYGVSNISPAITGISDINSMISKFSAAPTISQNNSVTFGDIKIDHVEDYNDFVTQLQRDPKFEKMIQSMTTDLLGGGSSLDKYKYHWK